MLTFAKSGGGGTCCEAFYKKLLFFFFQNALILNMKILLIQYVISQHSMYNDPFKIYAGYKAKKI